MDGRETDDLIDAVKEAFQAWRSLHGDPGPAFAWAVRMQEAEKRVIERLREQQ